jgi:hypothetical protein
MITRHIGPSIQLAMADTGSFGETEYTVRERRRTHAHSRSYAVTSCESPSAHPRVYTPLISRHALNLVVLCFPFRQIAPMASQGAIGTN